jgi:hypothetical protein
MRVRNPFYIYYRRQQVQIDLVDVHKLAGDNDGYRNLVCCIDCFSKFLWVRPTKTKSGREVLAAIQNMIEAMGEPPKNIFCDRGTELKNQHLQAYLREKKINLIHPSSEAKAAIVERVNRSLQGLLYRYLTEKRTNRYVDALPSIVETYNRRPHRSIAKLSPHEAELPQNAEKVLGALRQHYEDCKRPIVASRMLKVGDVVRFKTNYGKAFARGYEQQYSKELCKIETVRKRMAVPMYTLRSLMDGELIEGGWYREELQPYTDQVAIARAVEAVHAVPHQRT